MIVASVALAAFVRTALAIAGAGMVALFGCNIAARYTGVRVLGTRPVRIAGALGGVVVIWLGFWLSQAVLGLG